MTQIELKPCPHCGEAEELYRSYHGLGGGEPYAIDCLGCGCDFTPREGMDVVALWNTRAPDPAIATKDAEIARLQAENERMREALEWYADEIMTYSVTQVNEPRSAVHADRGRRARSALSPIDPAGGQPVEVESTPLSSCRIDGLDVSDA